MNKTLSISIAAYNAEKDISRCLESFIKSKVLDDLDIIVVNDGSVDKTSEIASKFACKYPNSIRVINKENGGHGSTINVGIVNSKGKYFKIVDSDDWVTVESIEKLVTYLKNSDVDLVFNPYYKISYENLNIIDLIDCKPSNTSYDRVYPIENLNGNEDIRMHTITYKTEVIKKVGPIIDENCFYVDMEYCIYPLIYVNNYVYLNFPVYNYLLGSQNQSVSLTSVIKRRNEHKKVIVSLVLYYKRKFQDKCNNLKSVVKETIFKTIESQFVIYIKMNSKQGKNELLSFVTQLNDLEFDYKISSSTLFRKLYWKFFKICNFHFYLLFCFIFELPKFIKLITRK